MANPPDSDPTRRSASRADVHPRVLRYDDEDTQLNARAPERPSAGAADPDATREISTAGLTPPPSPTLPVQLFVARDGALAAVDAEVTDLTRDALFVATRERPEPGRPVHLRVHSRFGVGTATGQVESELSGAGFVVRLVASATEFAEFADELRAYAEGRGRGCPPLVGPIELHVL